jgi:hypothetical protein
MISESQDARRKQYRRPHYERFYCGNCLLDRVEVVRLNRDGSCPNCHAEPLENAELPDAYRDGAE